MVIVRNLVWIVAGLTAWAAAPPLPPPATVIRDVTVIDPGSSLFAPHWSVLMAGGKILALGVIAEPPGVKAIDGTARFLIPGLWDMHVHLWNAENLPAMYLAYGVTGVRDMGSSFERTLALRSAIEDGKVVGPHILTSGPGLDGRKSDDARLPILTVTTPDEARRAVDDVNDMGADFLKVFSGIELEPYMAMLERARQLRLPVAGHLPAKIRLEDAVELKQASVEHFFGMEKISEKRLSKAFVEAARNGVRFTPTLTMHKRTLLIGLDTADPRLGLIPPELRKNWEVPLPPKEMREKAPRAWTHYLEMGRWLKASGVGILAGSDTGDPWTIPGGSLQDELVLLVEAGLSPLEALRGATSEAAKFNRLEGMFGGIGVGMVADVVLLDGDPLRDIANVRRVMGVCWRGRCWDGVGVEGLKRLL